MRFYQILFLLFTVSFFAQNAEDLKAPFEKGNGNQSATYKQCMNFYSNLDEKFTTIMMMKKGETDNGEHLQIVVYSENGNFDFNQNKVKILINNGIHPGEPDGIDASMMLMRDLATSKIVILKNTIVIVIPVYNMEGMLNRNATSRANQNGPEEYGFRGNGRNFDLNRDFIKSDTKNSISFQAIFHEVNPTIFIDNHVSNGADYQYVLTCISTQHERLGNLLGNYLKNDFYKAIVKDLEIKKILISPYVNIHDDKPDIGFAQFSDTPRYSTGYSSLFNAIGFVPETHMLKPYKDRVKVTYEFMVSTIKTAEKEGDNLLKLKLGNNSQYKIGSQYPMQWKIDSSKVQFIDFKGYEGKYKTSQVTQKPRLFYDKTKPFSKIIPFYGDFKPTKFVIIPAYYVIPKAQWEVLNLLKLNKIELIEIKKDSFIEVLKSKIKDYQTVKSPFEGHYLHYNTKVEQKLEKIKIFSGDFLVSTQQNGLKYLLETLEPEAIDSFFNWNFFDAILQQKEGYSAYVFEDLAVQILKDNPTLQTKLIEKCNNDKEFAKNAETQLDWVYENSIYFEKAYLQYPIYKIMK
jgi:hypothetical protein